MKTRDELVSWAVSLPSETWREISSRITWLHRHSGTLDDVPELLEAVGTIIIDPEAWGSVKVEVKKLRLYKSRQEKAEREAKALARRRDYMRAYMARRRRKERP